ncbi:MAG: ribonucleoside triphosphate reductase, partial [Oscillospiraceae bacterium]|nr:ribonucleoside triphosphate reductase [Oscillospiraceae bacterium]
MYRVIKRDGKISEFNIQKIRDAIEKAFIALNKQYHPGVLDMLALRVTADFESKIKDDLITVEDIQDSAESVLSEAGFTDVAKAYILYRKQREKVRNVGSAVLNYKELVDNYLQISDWRVKENSTVTYSVGGLILSNSGAITANYWLSEIYDKEIAEAHRSAAIHIHDLSKLTGYCAGWCHKQLNQEGHGGV